MSLGACF